MAKENKSIKCECRPVIGILGVLLLALGIYSLVMGFRIQILSETLMSWWALLSYAIGVLLLGFGMIARHKGYCQCKLHS